MGPDYRVSPGSSICGSNAFLAVFFNFEKFCFCIRCRQRLTATMCIRLARISSTRVFDN